MQNLVSCSILNFVDNFLSDGEMTDMISHYIPVVRDAGFDGMEIYLRTPSSSDIRRINRVAKFNKMLVTSAHFPKRLLDEPKSYCFEQIKHLVEASLAVDCDLGIIRPPWPGTLNESIEKTKSLLNDILPWTESQDFRLSIETPPIEKCNYYFKELIAEFGKELIYLTLDMEFLASAGFTVGGFCEAVDMLPENIHVNDFKGNPLDLNGRRRPPLLGTGSIDYLETGIILRRMSYEGIFTLETSLTHLMDPFPELIRSRNFISDKLA